MSFSRPLAVVAAVALLAAVAHAGTMFRLEIGPPVAPSAGKNIFNGAKKMVLAVRAVVCEDLAGVQVTGTAEGIRGGVRRSLPVTFTEVDKAEAIYAIGQQWPDDGPWLLHLRGSCSKPKASASTLVPVNSTSFIRQKTEVLREPATPQKIEAALNALGRSQS